MKLPTLLRKAVVTVAALACLPALAPAAQAAEVYGAIAYSQSTGTIGFNTGLSRAQAERNAFLDCQSRTFARDCETQLWFRNAWGALAVSSSGAFGTGWGYDEVNPDRGQFIAEKYALDTCYDYGGRDCRVIFARPAIPGYGR